MHRIIDWIVEPGFFSNSPVRVAMVVGTASALVSAFIGVLTVLRGQAFAGHALTDVAAAGGSGAYLLGIGPLFGFVGLGVVGAAAMDLIGVSKTKGRDLATGVVLGASIGFAALFLYLDTANGVATGAAQQILFGSIFTISSATIPVAIGLGALAVGMVALLYRPLVLDSISNEVALAKGVPVRLIGMMFMLALSIAVGLSSLSVGAILSTALLIGPAAAALRFTNRLALAIPVACAIGSVATLLGILLAYDSYYWGSAHQGLPVSFFIVAIVFLLYLASGISDTWYRRNRPGNRALTTGRAS